MSAAAFVARSRRDLVPPALLGFVVLAPLALCYVFYAGMFGPLIHQILGALFACLIVLASQMPQSLFGRQPVLRALTWVGTMSYSLYLVHEVVFKVIRPDRLHLENPGEATLTLFALARILVAVAFGYGFFWCFERPFLVRRRATRAEVVEATVLSPAP